MKLSLIKQAIKDSDRDTMEQLIKNLSEEIVEAGLLCDILPENIEEAYSGEFSSDEEFAQDMAEQTGSIDPNAGWPQTCIDWKYAAKELMYDYTSENGFYFRNI